MNMNNNIYHDLDLESVFQCPVCFELPSNVIFLCKIGHHMCDKCRKRLTVCPSCQSPLTGARNFLAEALMSKLIIFQGNGDTKENSNVSINRNAEPKLLANGLRENSKVLRPLPLAAGAYKCLLESCRDRSAMGVGTMMSHVGDKHPQLYNKFPNTSATFTHKFENFCFTTAKKKYHRAFHVSNMTLFFLNMEKLQDGYINCWLSIPAPVCKSNLFEYEIEFSKENHEGNKSKFISKVASNIQDVTWLLQRGQVFVISPAVHQLGVSDSFSLHIKIVYKPPTV